MMTLERHLVYTWTDSNLKHLIFIKKSRMDQRRCVSVPPSTALSLASPAVIDHSGQKINVIRGK